MYQNLIVTINSSIAYSEHERNLHDEYSGESTVLGALPPYGDRELESPEAHSGGRPGALRSGGASGGEARRSEFVRCRRTSLACGPWLRPRHREDYGHGSAAEVAGSAS